jgi:hypothetical protein
VIISDVAQRAFTVKDSGARVVFDGGMQRDITKDKIDYTLVLDGPLFERWAAHLTKGAAKYDARNWMKADGPEELARFKQSALRHLVQALRGDTDEDHLAAVCFNCQGWAYVQEKLAAKAKG